MRSLSWKWILGLIYIVAVSSIWIAASYVVQSVVDDGISPFLITYICNSLFMIYIPLMEVARYLEDYMGNLCFWQSRTSAGFRELAHSEELILLEESNLDKRVGGFSRNVIVDRGEHDFGTAIVINEREKVRPYGVQFDEDRSIEVDAKGRWTRSMVAKVSLVICPFWFMAQLTFNLSLKYTSVTSNTILSTSSSLFTFLLSLATLGEKFTWLKLIGVLLCMGGTVIVSLGDSEAGLNAINSNPVLGDVLSLTSACFYAVYITLIRKKLPDDGESGQVSMAQFLGFLGFFNMLIFLPVVLLLHFTRLESFTSFTGKQLGLIVGKGLLDNVLSDYLWAKAVLLTTTTVATAGLTIQVPLAAVVDTLTGHAPNSMNYIGAAAVMIGFVAINIPSDIFSRSKNTTVELENTRDYDESHTLSVCKDDNAQL
ncbi:hypothetical protein RND81_04G100200 [Saponaria officinalis]|uniref:EamA domain-containing protein n=1 Tax=Saponaria officinalis TaxID=3572 RepID=A0AAW1LDP8_SAPOF